MTRRKKNTFFTCQDCEFNFQVNLPLKNYAAKFKLGQPFNDYTLDDRNVVNVFRLTGDNQLTEEQINKGKSVVATKIVRDFTKDGIDVKMVAGSVISTAVFSRI